MFHLAPHVAACRVDDQVVLLDLRRNRYFGIGREAARGLACTVTGWPAIATAEPQAIEHASPDALVRLMRQDLVRPGPTASMPRHRLPAPARTLGIGAPNPAMPSTASLSGRIVMSAITAWGWLRLWSFETIARRLARPVATSDCAEPDPSCLAQVVGAYDSMRPLVLSRRDRCLHDSLTLILVLRSRGVLARWVIGVRVRPFAAHAWVQVGDLVLDDEHFRVGQFTPILVA